MGVKMRDRKKVRKKYFSKWNKQYRLKNKAKIKEAQKRYRLKNKAKIKEAKKQYRLKNKAKIKEARKQYRLKNKAKIKLKDERYRLKNKAKITAKYKERNRKQKERAVFVMGGKCCFCGYKKHLFGLAFHHITPSEKQHKVADLLKKNWTVVVAELKKCILICHNCHAELHAGVLRLPKNARSSFSEKLDKKWEKD